MNYLFTLFIIVFLFFLLQWTNAKKDYQTAKRLKQEFDDWFESNGNTKKPNNAEFARLFEKRYGMSSSIVQVHRGNSAVIVTENADLIASFPSLHNQLVIKEMSVLENLLDYFELQHKDVLSINYWINALIFLPSKIVQYLGVKETNIVSKLINFIYWIFSVAYLSWKPFLQDLISDLLK